MSDRTRTTVGSVVCILDDMPGEEPEIIGTGFVVGDGVVLTCHHVAAGHASLNLRSATGEDVRVAGSNVELLPRFDLAVVRGVPASWPALPLATPDDPPAQFWTTGYHRVGNAIRSAFPVRGDITGLTSVVYTHGEHDYAIRDAFVLTGATLGQGLSGAPLVDPRYGVVIGVVTTQLKNAPAGGGCGVPFAIAVGDGVVERIVRENCATVPAFGPYLNAPAARRLCRRQVTRALDELTRLRRVNLEEYVPRTEANRRLEEFLGGSRPVFSPDPPMNRGPYSGHENADAL